MLLLKFISFKRTSNNLWESDVLLFSGLINVVSILFYNFIEFLILLYTFLVIYFSRYKEYIIFLISFSKFLDVLRVLTCAKAIYNRSSICLRVSILRPSPLTAFILATIIIEPWSFKKLMASFLLLNSILLLAGIFSFFSNTPRFLCF